jgi:hypothetical protein
MRWKGPKNKSQRTRTWFAWFPVTFDDGTRVWLEKISIEERYYDGDGSCWIGDRSTLRLASLPAPHSAFSEFEKE